jgi:hypothetical protein
MNDVIDRIEAELVSAHAREYRWLRLRRPRGRYLAAALAAVVVAVPAGAATSGWNPFDDPDRRLPAPTTTELPPATSLTSQLGVLRRPQTSADRSAPVERALRGFDDESHGVALGSVRLLPGGAVLVPVQRFQPRGPGGARAGDRKEDSVCLYSPSSDGTGGIGCFTAQEVHDGRAIGSQGTTVDGLVPDGVARVRLISEDDAAEATVRDNYFGTRLDPRAGPGGVAFVRTDRAVWLDSAGRELKTIDYARP